ncbi:drug/metabolite transporter (DMT)-like permease [Crossiella equi]|uniref:Drug/metabolite transporter (DMT)-like permease n=1 Tax=Crossiella equi TaxID=130796 RepID=A0ABS5AIK5_9PSEU|nr:DMT family transporter [Crossiella equi]MBP2476398.1 drug/metabolite transporter (DMT)-like permease [Crossiella equi]
MGQRMALLGGMAALCLVGGAVPVNGLLADYPLLSSQAIRYAIGAVPLLAWLLWQGGLPRVGLRDVLALLALAATGMVGFNLVIIEGQRYADPGFVAAVIGAAPLVVALVAPLAAGRRPRPLVVVGSLLVAAGVLVISGGGRWTAPGLGYALLAMLGEAGFTLFAVGVVRRIGAIATSAYACVAAAVGSAVLSPLVSDDPWPAPTGVEWLAMVVLGVLVTAVAFGLYYRCVSLIGPERAGVLPGLIPVAGLAVSVLLGREPLTLAAAAGALTVAAGCAVGQLSRGAGPGRLSRREPSAARPRPRPAVPA